MARGWESKAVETQIENASPANHEENSDRMSPQHAEYMRKKEGLLLSRSRVLNDLQVARHPRYRGILEEALHHLERELAELESHLYKQR